MNYVPYCFCKDPCNMCNAILRTIQTIPEVVYISYQLSWIQIAYVHVVYLMT